MRPTLLQYIRRLMTPFSRRGFYLTEKARDCLLRSVAAARSLNIYPYDDTLMRGFIEARSVAIPILDSAGVDFRKLLRDLKTDPSGHDGMIDDHFLHEYEHDIKGGQPFHVVQWASAIAESRGTKVIDSGVLLEGLFRQSFNAANLSQKQIRQIATRPLNE